MEVLERSEGAFVSGSGPDFRTAGLCRMLLSPNPCSLKGSGLVSFKLGELEDLRAYMM